MIAVFGLIITFLSIGYSSTTFTPEWTQDFLFKYAKYNMKATDPPNVFFPRIMEAIHNWGETLDKSNMKPPSDYPYFAFVPLWKGHLVPGKNKTVEFEDFCYHSIRVSANYDPKNSSKILITWDMRRKKSLLCDGFFAVASIQTLQIETFELDGKHTTTLEILPGLTPAEKWDMDNKGIRVFCFIEPLSQAIVDLLETVSLFEPYFAKFMTNAALERNVRFLKDYAGVTMTKRNITDITIDPNLVKDGDFFGVIRLDGLDPMLAWAMGSHTGHTAIAMRENGVLYIMESTTNSSYWPTNGIQKTPFDQWIAQAKKAEYQVVWEPLRSDIQKKLDVKTALKFFHEVQGTFYGYQNMLWAWVDTLSDNYPCLPPNYTLCLQWESLEVLIPIAERLIPGASILFNPAFNKRFGVTGKTLPELYELSAKQHLPTAFIPTIVEQDSWKYPMQYTNGSTLPGYSMMCCAFVCHMWKYGGLFDELPNGRNSVNCNEFNNFDAYGLDMFNPSDKTNRPNACKIADPDNSHCQLLGEYTLNLFRWDTIKPHAHMGEKCPSRAPNYTRPADC